MLVLSPPSLVADAVLGSIHGWGNYDITRRPRGLANAISLRAAADYTYVLRSDHTIALWGGEGNGQLDAPPGLSNVVAIAAGYYMAMALTGDGNVQVWGAGGHVYQSEIIHPPASANNVMVIAGGMSHCLALRRDGAVIAWGTDLFGERDVPPGLSNVVQIAAGQSYSAAITSGGKIVSWGTSYYGPIPAEATNVVALSFSFFGHALALRADGTVVAWGNNSSGQANVPPGLSDVVAIAAGDQHSVALKSDGSLVAWGANAAGQGVVPTNFVSAKAIAAGAVHNVVISDAPLVEDVNPDQSVPAGSDLVLEAFVAGSLPWGSVWLKDGAALAQTNATLNLHDLQALDGGIYSFIASNAFGSTSSRGISVQVNPAAPRWKQQPQNQAVLPGQTALFFADAWGSEPLQYRWAHNGTAIPGATNAALQLSPVSIANEGAYTVQVSNQYGSISNVPCYLAANLPRLLCEPTDMRVRTNWVISLDVTVLSPLPVDYRWFKDGLPITGATAANLRFPSVQASDAGEYGVEVSSQNGSVRSDPVHVIILPNQSPPPEPGVVVEWGNVPYSSPAALNQETNVVGLTVGNWHTLVLHPDGTLRLWCNPQDLSLLNIPSAATNVAEVVAGPSFCLAIRNDGTVVGWGGETSGFGLSPSTPGNSSVVAVAAGSSSCFLLKADGSVAAVPDSVYVPPDVTNIIAVSLTSQYALALRANGKVLTWSGWDTSLAHEVPGLDKVIAIAGGEAYNSVALRSDGTVVEWNSYAPANWTVVGGVTNAVAVAGGRGFMALFDTGEVRNWETSYGNPPPPAGLKANRIAFQLVHQAALTPAPFFDLHPQSQTFYAGGGGTLAAAVRSATPLSLQWYFEGASITGATNLVL
jgi:alpha-tubulin suppressor-like RCC1 family protein